MIYKESSRASRCGNDDLTPPHTHKYTCCREMSVYRGKERRRKGMGGKPTEMRTKREALNRLGKSTAKQRKYSQQGISASTLAIPGDAGSGMSQSPYGEIGMVRYTPLVK